MSYRTPELLLVGAAANLVLDASGAPKNQLPTECVQSAAFDEISADVDEYSLRADW